MHKLVLNNMQKHTYSTKHKEQNCKAIKKLMNQTLCTYIHYRENVLIDYSSIMLYQNWLFSSSFHPITLSSASSLAGLVYCYMRKDKAGGTHKELRSRRNSLQLQPQQLPSCLLHVFCVCIVSDECSRCFMGSRKVKSQRRCQVFMMKMCESLACRLECIWMWPSNFRLQE